MATSHELAAMRRAIVLSAFGLGTTSPNPPVGCVILDNNGGVVGQGHHRRKGEDHAEALALAQAGGAARGGTAVVTLEPCNHYGRTPPCDQALIDLGVRRVLIALMDPTSRGEGGAALLRRAGLEVEVGVLAEEALLVLGPWLRALGTRRPHVCWLRVLDNVADWDVLTAVPGAAALKARHDVLITANGRTEEAVAGAHGNSLVLPTRIDLAEPKAALEALYRAGVRSVLLIGNHCQLVTAGLVDRVSMYLKGEPATAGTMLTSLAIPEGFRVIEATKLRGWVRLTACADEGPSGHRPIVGCANVQT